MRFLKSILISIFALVFFVLPAYAQEGEIEKNFDIKAAVSYNVSENGVTRVSQKITIKNKSEFIYIPSYAITIPSEGTSDVEVTGSTGSIPFEETGSNGRKTFAITFPDKVVGVGKTNTFTFSYNSSSIAQQTGNVWRVYIPSVSDSTTFSSYTVSVDVPSSFGPATIIKPAIVAPGARTHFEFNRSDLKNSGISITFGKFQVYNFQLTYNLENKNLVPVRTEIALPPNTAYQNVYIKSISKMPENVYRDTDGNFLATYLLSPKEKIAITADVLITSFSSPQGEQAKISEDVYLKPQKYWDTTDREIQKLAKEYNTPRKIYDFIVGQLSYNKEKAESNNVRLGAKDVLKHPDLAVCLEFTDLFIALARAAGIPARAVEGYAYTLDEEDQPLSLYQDILHSWPEYWDSEKKTWVMIDPTWGNTTKGVDYFNTFDFDHVAFVINGVNSEYPVPAGGYKTDVDSKDVQVSFGGVVDALPEDIEALADVNAVLFSNTANGNLTIKNNVGVEISKKTYAIIVDNKKESQVTFSQIPPFGSQTLSFPIQSSSKSFIPERISNIISIENENGEIIFSKNVYILPISYWYVIGGGVILAATILSIIAIKTRSLPFQGRQRESTLRGEGKGS